MRSELRLLDRDLSYRWEFALRPVPMVAIYGSGRFAGQAAQPEPLSFSCGAAFHGGREARRASCCSRACKRATSTGRTY